MATPYALRKFSPHTVRFSVANLQTKSDKQKFMDKILFFFKTSNRYKHLIGGFIVGLMAFGVFPAIYTSAVAASCLELKDKLHGCYWDWLDWILTIAGGSIAAAFWLII